MAHSSMLMQMLVWQSWQDRCYASKAGGKPGKLQRGSSRVCQPSLASLANWQRGRRNGGIGAGLQPLPAWRFRLPNGPQLGQSWRGRCGRAWAATFGLGLDAVGGGQKFASLAPARVRQAGKETLREFASLAPASQRGPHAFPASWQTGPGRVCQPVLANSAGSILPACRPCQAKPATSAGPLSSIAAPRPP